MPKTLTKIKKHILYLKYLFLRRYPCILQSDENDCGAACFATIARHYGYYMNLEQANELVQVHQMGQSVWDLKAAALEIGLDGYPAKAVYSALKEIEWPFIAHYGGEIAHFVVVYEVYDGFIVIGDPARGIEVQSKEEFQEKWSGYLVEFMPTQAFKKAVVTIPAYRLFCRIILEYLPLLRWILVLSVFLSLAGMASSYFVKVVIDNIIPQETVSALTALTYLLISIYFFQFILIIFRGWIQSHIGREIEENNLFKYFDHIFRLPLKFHEVRSTGNLYNRMLDIQRIRIAISESLVSLFSDFIFMIAAFTVMFFYNAQLAMWVLSFIPVLILVIFVFSLPIRRQQGIYMGKTGEAASSFIDALNGISELKIFSAEEHFISRLKKKTQEYIQSNFNLNILLTVSSAMSLLGVSLLTVFLLSHGAMLVSGGKITLGEMMFFFSLVAFVVSPIQRSSNVFFLVQDALVAIERIYAICEIKLENKAFCGQKIVEEMKGKIEFKDVSFGYRKKRNILENINFIVNPGEILAIVGETGVGKSTLTKLICGFYMIDSGDILFDDVSLKELDMLSLRKNISAVFQRPHLFNESIFHNITMGGPFPLEQVEKMFQQKKAFQFIDNLPQKYLANVFSGGSNFSEGQIQRIAILRALARNSPVLIFDEATSNLDSQTEETILEILRKERKNKTTIIVGHRLSTISLADNIIVLKDGKIAESGSLKRLMEKKEYFYRLFHAQLEEKGQS
ncbi:MAG: peptidase domain-containing ABC transporter [Candidatus Omnitrophica bacterium]|nr:peptidase domain-containing ABC transporter [Candidatus Omnitrophota bacterium]